MDESQTDKSEECEESVDDEDKGGRHNRGHKQGGDGKNHAKSSVGNSMNFNTNDNVSNHVLHRMNLNVKPERPSGNTIDIDNTLEKILSNDASVNTVNLNNIENISRVVLVSFAEALTSNTQVKTLCLANTHADDQVAVALAEMLKKNRSITDLNVESNFITVGSPRHNATLMELRFHNQRHASVEVRRRWRWSSC